MSSSPMLLHIIGLFPSGLRSLAQKAQKVGMKVASFKGHPEIHHREVLFLSRLPGTMVSFKKNDTWGTCGNGAGSHTMLDPGLKLSWDTRESD